MRAETRIILVKAAILEISETAKSLTLFLVANKVPSKSEQRILNFKNVILGTKITASVQMFL